MRDEELSEEDLIKNEVVSLKRRVFNPRNLRIAIFGAIFLILFVFSIVYILIKVSDTRPKDAFFWHKEIDKISFTSYAEPTYGTFFSSIKVNLAYADEEVKKEINQKKSEILNTIRQVLSEQHFYKINNDFKLKYNLTPILRRRINMLLSKSNGVQDISYPFIRLMLNRNTRGDKLSYFDLGTYNANINKLSYNTQIYIVYDSSSSVFNDYLNKRKLEIDRIIKPYLNTDNLTLSQRRINSMLNNTIEEYFNKLEEDLKEENPYYNIKGRFKNVFLAYFVPS